MSTDTMTLVRPGKLARNGKTTPPLFMMSVPKKPPTLEEALACYGMTLERYRELTRPHEKPKK